jgi:hypothetical protein
MTAFVTPNEVKSLNTKPIKIRHRTYEQDHLGPNVNSQYSEIDPSVTAVGKHLYFSSYNLPGGLGGHDIYRTEAVEETRVVPSSGGNRGIVTVRVFGLSLQQGTTVKLTRSGFADIVGSTVSVDQYGYFVKTAFDLTGQEPGLWDVCRYQSGRGGHSAPARLHDREWRSARHIGRGYQHTKGTFLTSEEPCGRDRRASKSKFKQPELFNVFFSNSAKYIGTAAETAGCNSY